MGGRSEVMAKVALVPVNDPALPEARFGWGVSSGKEFRARPNGVPGHQVGCNTSLSGLCGLIGVDQRQVELLV
jgi:hypothetical protein